MKKMIVMSLFATMAVVVAASPLPDYPFVFVKGEARLKVAPDICRVEYRVVIRDKNPDKAMAVINTRSIETITSLLGNGVKKEDIISFEVDKSIVRDEEAKQIKQQQQANFTQAVAEKEDPLAFLGYEMTRRFTFTLRNIRKYEPIAAMLLKSPDVVDIQSSFSRTDRKEVDAKLLAAATADAKSKAESIAESADQRIVKLRAISLHGFDDLEEAFIFGNNECDATGAAFRDEPMPAVMFVPSTIEFASSVSVIYEIAEKK